MLELLAAPLARTLQAVRLAETLHASRGRVVQAREEERRRLRRDLHGGWGPVLTGVAYRVVVEASRAPSATHARGRAHGRRAS